MWVRLAGVSLLAIATACGAAEESSELSACQPLEAPAAEISLGEIVGAGEDARGVIYVIDEVAGELRAFISNDGVLVRQRVSGTGQGNAGGAFTVVSLNELDPPVTLQVTVDASGGERMGVVTGPLDSKTFVVGEQGEELSLLPADAVHGLPLANYDPEIVVEYAAVVEGGRTLIALRPRDFQDYSQFRVFLGPAEHLDERAVSAVTRARDGGSTTLDFDVDGERARAEFPVEFVDEQFTPGAPSLRIGDRELDIALTTPTGSPAGASYYCAR